MGYVRASGAPEGSRGQRETTHEVFLSLRSYERVARKARKKAKMFHFAQGSIAQWLYITDEEMAFTERLLFSRRKI